MKRQKILLFGSTSEICKDLMPKLKNGDNDINCFHRSRSKYYNKTEDEKYIFLNHTTNINNKRFDKIFQNWDVAIFFYGDFGEIGNFHEIKYEKWKKSFDINLFFITRRLHRLLYHSDLKKTKSVITFSGSGTNGPSNNYSSYTIAKIALIKLSELMDSEY